MDPFAKQKALAAILKPAKGRPIPTGMNKTERAFSVLLEARKAKGEVLWWGYECWTFKLGPDVRYTPDFPVMLSDGSIEINETKGGFYRDDAKAKFQMAAGLFPFVFRWWALEKGVWSMRTPFPEDR